MIRAAAKNFGFSAVVVKPESYDAILQELRGVASGRLSLATRESLAVEAFNYTARYDTAISRWFVEKHDDFPPIMLNAYEKVTDLAYGENPHQRAAYYRQVGARMHVLSMVRQLGGKELSFNNVLDLNAGAPARRRVRAAGLRDHQAQQPVRLRGRRLGARGLPARVRVRPAERVRRRDLPQPPGRRARSPRRSRTSSSRSCSRRASPTRRSRSSRRKPNLRILEDGERRRINIAERDIKRVLGGVLVQDRDMDLEDRTEMEVVTERKPSEREWGEMLFAWKVCKHVRSNAIVLAKDLASVGIGAGQMSRVDSVRLAIDKAARDRHRPDRRRARLRRVLPVLRRARSSRSTPASPRSSSPAAPSATTRSSRPPTPPASRWSSRTAGTSSTRPRSARATRSIAYARVSADPWTPRHRPRRRRRPHRHRRRAARRPGRLRQALARRRQRAPGRAGRHLRPRRRATSSSGSAPSGRSAGASATPRPWLIASAAADTADLVAIAALARGPDDRRRSSAPSRLAGGSAVLFAWLQSELVTRSRRARATRSS